MRERSAGELAGPAGARLVGDPAAGVGPDVVIDSRRTTPGSLFVALHGSWNRKNPIGPKVVRVPFDAQGRAMPFYEDFMTGFTVSDYKVWGRPVGVAVGKDGALYVSEDANRTIWCVAPKSQMP